MSTPGPDPRHRLVDIVLDQGSIVRWTRDIQQDIDIAIFDIKESNLFRPQDLPADVGPDVGPFVVRLASSDNRLVLEIQDETGTRLLDKVFLAMTPFRKLIRDYFTVCESYYEAIRKATPQQIEAIDMGRRGLHNEAATLLRERLDGKIEIDTNTARRLFTLICVLHLRDAVQGR